MSAKIADSERPSTALATAEKLSAWGQPWQSWGGRLGRDGGSSLAVGRGGRPRAARTLSGLSSPERGSLPSSLPETSTPELSMPRTAFSMSGRPLLDYEDALVDGGELADLGGGKGIGADVEARRQPTGPSRPSRSARFSSK